MNQKGFTVCERTHRVRRESAGSRGDECPETICEMQQRVAVPITHPNGEKAGKKGVYRSHSDCDLNRGARGGRGIRFFTIVRRHSSTSR